MAKHFGKNPKKPAGLGADGPADEVPKVMAKARAAAEGGAAAERKYHAIFTFDVPTYNSPSKSTGAPYTTSKGATEATRKAIVKGSGGGVKTNLPATLENRGDLRTHLLSEKFSTEKSFTPQNVLQVKEHFDALDTLGRFDMSTVRAGLFLGSKALLVKISPRDPDDDGAAHAGGNTTITSEWEVVGGEIDIQPPLVMCYTLERGMHEWMYTTMYHNHNADEREDHSARWWRFDDATFVRGSRGKQWNVQLFLNEFVGELNKRRPDGGHGTIAFLEIETGCRFVHGTNEWQDDMKTRVEAGDGLYYN